MFVKGKIISNKSLGLIIYFFLFTSSIEVRAATHISFINGPLKRTITIDSIEYLAKEKKAEGLLEDLINFTRINPKEISRLVNQQFELKLMPTSRLMYSRIGEVLITRASKVIYPLKAKELSSRIPAFRAAIINGIVLGEGKLSILTFLKAYPNKTVVVNIAALKKVINKIDSINDLVKFFSKSPLEPLK